VTEYIKTALEEIDAEITKMCNTPGIDIEKVTATWPVSSIFSSANRAKFCCLGVEWRG